MEKNIEDYKLEIEENQKEISHLKEVINQLNSSNLQKYYNEEYVAELKNLKKHLQREQGKLLRNRQIVNAYEIVLNNSEEIRTINSIIARDKQEREEMDRDIALLNQELEKNYRFLPKNIQTELKNINYEEKTKKSENELETEEQEQQEITQIASAYNQIKSHQQYIEKLRSLSTSDPLIKKQNDDLISLLIKQIEENKAVLPENLKIELDKQEENLELKKEEPIIELDSPIIEEIPVLENNQTITMEEVERTEDLNNKEISEETEQENIEPNNKQEEPMTLENIRDNILEKSKSESKEETESEKFTSRLMKAIESNDDKDIDFNEKELGWIKELIADKEKIANFTPEEKEKLQKVADKTELKLKEQAELAKKERKKIFIKKIGKELRGTDNGDINYTEEEINWLRELINDEEKMSKFNPNEAKRLKYLLSKLSPEEDKKDETIEEIKDTKEDKSEDKPKEENKIKKKVIGIRKPAKWLLNKIKRSKFAKLTILASAVLLLVIGGKGKNEKIIEDTKVEVINEESNTEENTNTEAQEENNTPLQTTYDNDGNIISIVDEEGNKYNEEEELIEINDTTVDDTYLEDNDITIEDINNYDYNYETEYVDNNYEEDKNIKIGSTVTVNGNIHDNVYDAYYNENSKTPYYGTEPERVVIGVGIINNNAMNRIYAYDPEANTKIENLLNEGGEMVSILTSNKNKYLQDYDGTTSLSPEEIKAYAEGWYNINDINTNITKGVTR